MVPTSIWYKKDAWSRNFWEEGFLFALLQLVNGGNPFVFENEGVVTFWSKKCHEKLVGHSWSFIEVKHRNFTDSIMAWLLMHLHFNHLWLYPFSLFFRGGGSFPPPNERKRKKWRTPIFHWTMIMGGKTVAVWCTFLNSPFQGGPHVIPDWSHAPMGPTSDDHFCEGKASKSQKDFKKTPWDHVTFNTKAPKSAWIMKLPIFGGSNNVNTWRFSGISCL